SLQDGCGVVGAGWPPAGEGAPPGITDRLGRAGGRGRRYRAPIDGVVPPNPTLSRTAGIRGARRRPTAGGNARLGRRRPPRPSDALLGRYTAHSDHRALASGLLGYAAGDRAGDRAARRSGGRDARRAHNRKGGSAGPLSGRAARVALRTTPPRALPGAGAALGSPATARRAPRSKDRVDAGRVSDVELL